MASDDTAKNSSAASDEGAGAARFGTFGGVFTPCTLTILGVIMFMRAGYVVGEGGLIYALIILAIAKTITTLTTLSLSAIATNTEVKGGGVYYIISRTLGHDFGGAIGLTLFVSQAISIAFYVIGFTEALFGLFPGDQSQMLVNLTSSGVICLVFFVTFKGADVAIKAQYPILAVLILAIISYLVKGVLNFDAGLMTEQLAAPEDTKGFWILFAIFFPAATGITAGANMSGDLKDPSTAIPRGTLAAIAFTGAVYV
ncbi:MAG: amino acid permease, partial [Deltaproteobacteria bacterium]|nr:amino acid permease [Deltaproteobacteria bacterium]